MLMKRTVKEITAMMLTLIAKIAKILFLLVEIKRTGIQIRNQTFFSFCRVELLLMFWAASWFWVLNSTCTCGWHLIIRRKVDLINNCNLNCRNRRAFLGCILTRSPGRLLQSEPDLSTICPSEFEFTFLCWLQF
jgi:hypothetical protein